MRKFLYAGAIALWIILLFAFHGEELSASFQNYVLTDSVSLDISVKDEDVFRDGDSVVAKICYREAEILRVKLFDVGVGRYWRNINAPDTFGAFPVRYVIYASWITDSAEVSDQFRTDSLQVYANLGYQIVSNVTYGNSALKDYVDVLPATAPSSWSNTYMDLLRDSVINIAARLTAARGAKLDSITVGRWSPTALAPLAALIADSVLNNDNPNDTVGYWLKKLAHFVADSVLQDSIAYQGQAAGLTATDVANEVFGRKVHTYTTNDSTFGYVARVMKDSVLRIVADTLYSLTRKMRDSLDLRITLISGGSGGLSVAQNDSLMNLVKRLREVQAILGIANTKVVYVDDGGTNATGQDWVNARTTIRQGCIDCIGAPDCYVLVAAGTYSNTRVEVGSNNVKIWGVDKNRVFVDGGNDSTGIFVMSSVSGAEIHNLNISTDSVASFAIGVGSRSIVNDCYISGHVVGSPGIFMLVTSVDANAIEVTKNIIDVKDTSMVFVSGVANNLIRFSRNRLLGNYSRGVYATALDKSIFAENVFAGAGVAIDLGVNSDSNAIFSNLMKEPSGSAFINSGTENSYIGNYSTSEFSALFTLQEDLEYVKNNASAVLDTNTMRIMAGFGADSVWYAKRAEHDDSTATYGKYLDTMVSDVGLSTAQNDSLNAMIERQKDLLAFLGGYQRATYYVDSSTGSDLNSGLSWSTAKATVVEAVNAVTLENSVVFVGRGTYDEESVAIDIRGLRIIGAGQGRTFVRGATSNNAIFTVTGSDIEISDLTLFGDSVNTAFVSIGASDVSIHDCDFYGMADAAGTPSPVISISAGNQRARIFDNRISAIGSSAIVVSADAKYTLIKDNVITGVFSQYVLDVNDASYAMIENNVLNNFSASGVFFRSGSDTTLFVSNKVNWATGASVTNSSGSHATVAFLDNVESYEQYIDDPSLQFSDQYYLSRLESRTDSLKDTVDFYSKKTYLVADSGRDTSISLLAKIDTRTDSLKDTVDFFGSRLDLRTDSLKDTVDYWSRRNWALSDSLRDSALDVLSKVDVRTDSIKDTVSYWSGRTWTTLDSLRDTSLAWYSKLWNETDSLRDSSYSLLSKLDLRTDSIKDTVDAFARAEFLLLDSVRDTTQAILFLLRSERDTIGLIYSDMYKNTDSVLFDIGELVDSIYAEDTTGHIGDLEAYGYLMIQAATGGFGTADRDTLRYAKRKIDDLLLRTDSIKDTVDYWSSRNWAVSDSLRDSALDVIAEMNLRTDSIKDTVDYWSRRNWALTDSLRDSALQLVEKTELRTDSIKDTVDYWSRRIWSLADSIQSLADTYLDSILALADSTNDSTKYYLARIYGDAERIEDSVNAFGARNYWLTDSLRDTSLALLSKLDSRSDSLKDSVDTYLSDIYGLSDSIRDTVNYHLSRLYGLGDSIRDTVNKYLDQSISSGYEETDFVKLFYDSAGWYVWTYDSANFAATEMGRFNIDGGTGSGGGSGTFLQTDRDTLFELIEQLRAVRDSLSSVDSVWLFTSGMRALADVVKDSILNTQTDSDTTAFWMKWLAGLAKDSVGTVGTVAANEIALAVWNTKQFQFKDSVGTYGQFLDTLVSALLGVTGQSVVDLYVFDSTTDLPIYNAKVLISNHEDSRVVSYKATDASGRSAFVFGTGDTVNARVTALGYSFTGIPKQVPVSSGINRDTVYGYLYSPSAPHDTAICTVYGQILNASGVGEYKARIRATINSSVTVKFGEILLNRWSVEDTTTVDGRWEVPAFKGKYLRPLNTSITFTAVDSLGNTLNAGTSVVVPDSTNYLLKWK